MIAVARYSAVYKKSQYAAADAVAVLFEPGRKDGH
jgi:hypothetical protein